MATENARIVLLVDDEESIRETFTMACEHFGFDVLTAADGEEALGIVLAHDELYAILLDAVLPPGTDGARRFLDAAEGMLDGVKVIIVSGREREGLVEAFASCSVAETLVKPVSVERLRLALAGED